MGKQTAFLGNSKRLGETDGKEESCDDWLIKIKDSLDAGKKGWNSNDAESLSEPANSQSGEVMGLNFKDEHGNLDCVYVRNDVPKEMIISMWA